jgi:hypothetical protein
MLDNFIKIRRGKKERAGQIAAGQFIRRVTDASRTCGSVPYECAGIQKYGVHDT